MRFVAICIGRRRNEATLSSLIYRARHSALRAFSSSHCAKPLPFTFSLFFAMLDAFKIKPFDLEPVLASWTDAPRFVGKPKKDLPVDDWLAQIKAGCVARKVPRDYWYKVGQHFLEGKAKKRFEEVREVMKNMHAGKYKWNWKNFKIAMRNMGWDIDGSRTEAIKVQSKASGFWWIVGRVGESQSTPPPQSITHHKSRSLWDVTTRKNAPTPKRAATTEFPSKPAKRIPTPKRSATMDSVDTVSSFAASMFSRNTTPKSTPATSAAGTPASTPGECVTTVTHAPLWLVQACQSLDVLTNEHPKVMTALSAVLITVGSLPALPAVSAGAGPAFLATSTAHALGSIAVGLGTWLKAQSEGQVQVSDCKTKS